MTARTTCRSCDGADLRVVLSLGETPLANSLLTKEQLNDPEPRYPLALAFCRGCSLLQITDTVSPELLFRDYLYLSSYSDTMVEHAQRLAADIIGGRHLDVNSLVVEIASNDGYLLRNFVGAGIPVLGIEPARKIAELAEGRGIRTLSEFFGTALAKDLAGAGQRADVIVANNVMAHVPDINDVVAGIRILLKPHGVFVMETPYVKDLIDRLEFDTIYHEHVFYYSLTALERLFQRHGLAAAHVERLSLHGGSLQVTAVPAGTEGDRPAVCGLLDEEERWGVSQLSFYDSFADRVAWLRQALRGLLADLKAQGHQLAAYGASAKGSTLLNTSAIGRDMLDFVVDRSPVKQGRYTPGTHLPIYPPERLLVEQPAYTLLLTWNFAEEIRAQQREYQRRGGRFILPLPQPQIVPSR